MRHHIAHPHRRADDLGVATQVDYPPRPVQRGQHRRHAGLQVAGYVVLDHPQAVPFGHLQDAEGIGHPDAGA
ncbi:hypothetical protein G6F50_018022 [Rhizopus delemar]|uniref:Uncharacterized protein n=1 Tax=Rhizopus delemar TaxID=936053 RepID=A0A9P6XNJ7_9FUNG|nr:hypothetical protein G6F50_018022 [Rhizopus delemar]